MKLKLRFTIHFILGLLVCLLSMGITVMLTIDILFPAIGIVQDNKYYDLYVILIFIFHIIVCSILFS